MAHRQYLGTVTAPDPPELLLDELPDDVPPSALPALRKHHRSDTTFGLLVIYITILFDILLCTFDSSTSLTQL